MASSPTPSASPAICAMTVSDPWPMFTVPMRTSKTPSSTSATSALFSDISRAGVSVYLIVQETPLPRSFFPSGSTGSGSSQPMASVACSRHSWECAERR